MRKMCLETVFELAKKNNKIVFIGSDLGPGVLDNFKKKYPNRFLMEGVAEQAIIGMAAGLAMQKFRPYVNTIATLPNLTILAPCDSNDMKNLVLQTTKIKGPIYIRIARGGEKIITNGKKSKIGKGLVLKSQTKFNFLTTGITAQIALDAAKKIKKKYNMDVGVVHFSTVKPLDKKLLKKIIINSKKIITIEENVVEGGFGSSILEFSSNLKKSKNNIHLVGLKNEFSKKYGTQQEILEFNNLKDEYLCKKMYNFIIND
jgi:transketolase